MDQWKALSVDDQSKVRESLLKTNDQGVQHFKDTLEKVISRQIEVVYVSPVHGAPIEVATIEDAVRLIESHDETKAVGELVRYEVIVRFNNGNEVSGRFNYKASTVEFLKTFVGA